MDSKKKIIISVSAFVVVLLATVVAVVSVLAATNVSFTSSIKVTYTVGDVVADVAVSMAKVKTTATSITWGTPQTKDFAISYSGSGESISFADQTLAKDECVVIKFVFNNNSAKGFTATLTPPTVVANDNVNILYATSETGLAGLTSTAAGANGTVSVASGADKTGTYYAVIKIADTTKNVSGFTANFAWTLA